MTDWLMVIITAIYVIATIVICYFNGKSASAAKKQTEEMIRQYNEANRPCVTVHFDIIRGGILCLVIENEGNKPAHNVSLKICEKFISGIASQNDKSRLRDLSSAKLYLSSNQKMYICLGGQHEFNTISENTADIVISYDGYVEETSIDLKQYGLFLIYTSPFDDIVQQMKKIQRNDDKFYRKVTQHLDAQSKVQNVVIHQETEDEANKHKIFKKICCEEPQSANSLAKSLGLDEEYVLQLLIELQKCVRQERTTAKGGEKCSTQSAPNRTVVCKF